MQTAESRSGRYRLLFLAETMCVDDARVWLNFIISGAHIWCQTIFLFPRFKPCLFGGWWTERIWQRLSQFVHTKAFLLDRITEVCCESPSRAKDRARALRNKKVINTAGFPRTKFSVMYSVAASIFAHAVLCVRFAARCLSQADREFELSLIMMILETLLFSAYRRHVASIATSLSCRSWMVLLGAGEWRLFD